MILHYLYHSLGPVNSFLSCYLTSCLTPAVHVVGECAPILDQTMRHYQGSCWAFCGGYSVSFFPMYLTAPFFPMYLTSPLPPKHMRLYCWKLYYWLSTVHTSVCGLNCQKTMTFKQAHMPHPVPYCSKTVVRTLVTIHYSTLLCTPLLLCPM